MTVQEFIEMRQNQFLNLSRSRANQLRREARQVANHMRDVSNFRRGLSANQVLSARRIGS